MTLPSGATAGVVLPFLGVLGVGVFVEFGDLLVRPLVTAMFVTLIDLFTHISFLGT